MQGMEGSVNSEQVSWFLTKTRHRAVRFGILIAANGITGEPEHLSRANFLVGVEMATFGIKMVIVTRVGNRETHVRRRFRQTDHSEGLHPPCFGRSLLLRAANGFG